MPSLLEKCAVIAGAVGLKQPQLAALLEEQGAAARAGARTRVPMTLRSRSP